MAEVGRERVAEEGRELVLLLLLGARLCVVLLVVADMLLLPLLDVTSCEAKAEGLNCLLC